MKKFTFVLAVLFFPLFALAGCGGNGDPNTIRLSEVTHSIFYAPLYIALNNDYFEDEGLKVELSNGNGSDNVMTAILSGQADIGLCGPETAVYVAKQGNTDLPKVFGQLTACDGSFLVARNAEPDFTLESLRNKTIIGGRRGGMPAMTLQHALNEAGMTAGEDYTLNLDYDFGMVAAVFEGGTGDYCTMFEPAASDYVAQGKGHIVASIGELGGKVPYTAFISNSSYLTKHSLQAEQFLRAIYRGYRFMVTADIEDVVDSLMPSFVGSSRENIKSSIENYLSIGAFATTPVMNHEGYDRLLSIIREAGELTGTVTFDTVIDNTIATKVVKYFA